MSRPLILGLTGSIGMGKSTVAEMFERHGLPVFDADAEVRRMQGPEGELVPAIEAEFPGSTGPDGVKREALGVQVFGDPAALAQLEAIVHPMVRDLERDFLHAEIQKGAAMAVLEIPLLFETGGDKLCDVTVVVSAPAQMQRERVLQRPGMTPEKLDEILARQMPDADKRARADFVVDTGGTIAESQAQIDKIIARLKERSGTAYHRYWAQA